MIFLVINKKKILIILSLVIMRPMTSLLTTIHHSPVTTLSRLSGYIELYIYVHTRLTGNQMQQYIHITYYIHTSIIVYISLYILLLFHTHLCFLGRTRDYIIIGENNIYTTVNHIIIYIYNTHIYIYKYINNI